MPDDVAASAIQQLAARPPAWLASLGTPSLGGPLGVTALDPADWSEPDLTDYPARTVRLDTMVTADRAVRAGKVLVAKGPSTTKRPGSLSEMFVQWYVDPATPDRLWCALSDRYPGWLWVPVEPTADALREVLDDMFPTPARRRVDLTRWVRGFVGHPRDVPIPNVYDGEYHGFDGYELDRYFFLVPFVDGGSWGSFHLDDPLRDDLREAPGEFAMAHEQAKVMASKQEPGRVPSMTWRSLHSRSYLSIEVNMRHFVCARLGYRPAPPSHQAVLAAANRDLALNLPPDLPLDLAGAMSGYDFMPAAELERLLGESLAHPAADVNVLAARIGAFAAVWEGDLAHLRRLREYARHPLTEVRETVRYIANWYNMRFLLYEVALHSNGDSDEERQLRSYTEELLDADHTPDDLDPFYDGLAEEEQQ
jgi:hypothetical protein